MARLQAAEVVRLPLRGGGWRVCWDGHVPHAQEEPQVEERRGGDEAADQPEPQSLRSPIPHHAEVVTVGTPTHQ